MDSKNSLKKKETGISRRRFLGSSAALVGGALISPLAVEASANVASSDTLKIALIGCGGRGTGAAVNALRTEGPTELVAMADVFRSMIDRSYDNVMGMDGISQHVNVPEEHKFVGLEAYKDAIELADVVLLATPPAFRPHHFEAAVQAGKHVFMEKPLSSDAPGARKIFETGKRADEKGLCVAVGLQNHYAVRYKKAIEQIRQGAIGEITSMECNYLISGIRLVDREPGDTEMQYQLRNWRRFEWLWAGSPAALTIHYEDIAHWAKGSYPVRAFGTGGRFAERIPEYGDIYDHYYIEYEYADGTKFHSRTRHIEGCWQDRGSRYTGTEGVIEIPAGGPVQIKNLKGDTIWTHRGDDDPNPFQLVLDECFAAIRSGNPYNDTPWAGKSSMASLLGRMAVQSGHRIDWDEAYNSDLLLVPADQDFNSQPPAVPDENGIYPVPVPGSKRGIL